MTDAIIEVRATDVKGAPYVPFLGDAQHLLIIYTNSLGKKIIIRGGPKNDNHLIDDLEIIKDSYEKTSDGKLPIDWAPHALRRELAKGTDAEMQIYVDKMWTKAEAINREGFDYKLL